MVFHFPREIDAKLVREFDLAEGILEEFEFNAVGPRPGQLVLIENPELHSSFLL